jgi:chemotaxis response regulator CheB
MPIGDGNQKGKDASAARISGKTRRGVRPGPGTTPGKIGDKEGPTVVRRRKPQSLAPFPVLPRPRGHSFHIDGTGASAGGLDAFQQLFSTLPPQAGMAFIAVQHMDPKHGSMLREILSRSTRIPVMDAAEATTAKPDRSARSQQARKTQESVAEGGIRYRRNGEQKVVQIEFIPIKPVTDREACCLVLFMETASKAPAPGTGRTAGKKGAVGTAKDARTPCGSGRSGPRSTGSTAPCCH